MNRIYPASRISHIFEPTRFSYRDTKDPVVLFDKKNNIWHLYGSGGASTTEEWNILHAISKTGLNDWEELDPVTIHGLNVTPHTCAPGIISDDSGFHMFVQTEFMGPEGNIHYLHSLDSQNFFYDSTVINSLPGTNQASMYDPHPAIIISPDGRKDLYITYSAGPDTGYGKAIHGDIFLARSMSGKWFGPWKRLGVILSHEAVNHHNQHDHPDYEWGLEGAQIIQLPQSNKILLNAVCFLPVGQRGTRQRVFFALADSIHGPFKTLGPVLEPIADEWQSGENGHASGFIKDDKLYLYFQSRPAAPDPKWRYNIAQFDAASFASI